MAAAFNIAKPFRTQGTGTRLSVPVNAVPDPRCGNLIVVMTELNLQQGPPHNLVSLATNIVKQPSLSGELLKMLPVGQPAAAQRMQPKAQATYQIDW